MNSMDSNQLTFNPSEPYTIGVELEFQILDKDSLNLTPMSQEILNIVPDALKERFKPEFIQSMLEINTGICTNIGEVEKDLSGSCQLLEELAETAGCVVYASSLHPFAIAKEQKLSQGKRYGEIMEELQLVGRRLITQGLHVHVGLSDGETAIRVCDSIRTFLPVLLALTTSSPFFEGDDSGLYSYRSKLFAALPRSGMPGALGSWEQYKCLVNLLKEAKIIKEIRDLWWDVRPHPDFGTIEVRICDLPSRFEEILSMAALIHSLVFTLSEKHIYESFIWEVLLNNKWEAARYGLSGRHVDPVTNISRTFLEMSKDILNLTAPAASDLGNKKFLKPIKKIMEKGTSAHRQKKLYEETEDLREVIKEMREIFWN
jgi:carboxylate-amine ligase